MEDSRVGIVWYRRDLRVADHAAIVAASTQCGSVYPVYILSDWCGFHRWTGSKRQHFLLGCLQSLHRNLETLGSRLILRRGEALTALRELICATKATDLYAHRDPDPFGAAMERHIDAMCAELGVRTHWFEGISLHDAEKILTQDRRPYRVYTPYSRQWLQRPVSAPLAVPSHLNTPLSSDTVSAFENWPDVSYWGLEVDDTHLPVAGERAARLRLQRTLESVVSHYSERRDIPGLSATSVLSQDLRFGCLSIRSVAHAVMQWRDSAGSAELQHSATIFLKELAWRDFYFAILHHFPDVLQHEFDPQWRGLPWFQYHPALEAWKHGMTGFPLIDAGMRELLATGRMHNRVRMIVAMFLTKDLRVDWRIGEQWFMKHLIDGDIAANNGGWQWSAGTGADAAPYFRIQNPWTQTQRFDPDGRYIRQWVPELASVSAKKFQQAPPAGGQLATGYPKPVVNHDDERQRTLAWFQAHKINRNTISASRD